MYDDIESLIRTHVKFFGSNSKGWNITYCEVCGDGSRTQGPRGGWNFSDEMAFYHCFNCGVDGSFDPNREYPFSKRMRKILDSFGIDKSDYNAIAYAKKLMNGQKRDVKKTVSHAKPLEVPDFFIPLSNYDKDDDYAKLAYDHLKYRNINPDDYKFYLSNGKSNEGPRPEAIAKSFLNRLIIPFFDKDGNMIYYQARDLTGTSKKKYLNADSPKTAVIYGFDHLYKNVNIPLFVTEGFFDAYHMKGVSIQENSITNDQIRILNTSNRKKVFVPDKKSDSSKVIDKFIELGWYISAPDIGNSCKDVDDAIRKYGRLYTLNTINENIYPANIGKTYLKLRGFLK